MVNGSFSARTTVCRTRASSTCRKVWTARRKLLIDPNKFSTDGTSRLAAFSLSKDGKYLGYGISQGGSDWSNIYVMDDLDRDKRSQITLQWIEGFRCVLAW